jgi:hypothetical protein
MSDVQNPTLLAAATKAAIEATSGPAKFLSLEEPHAVRYETRAALIGAGFPAAALEQPPGFWIVVSLNG